MATKALTDVKLNEAGNLLYALIRLAASLLATLYAARASKGKARARAIDGARSEAVRLNNTAAAVISLLNS